MSRTPLAIGCDVGGSEIKVVALRGGRLLGRNRFPTPETESGRELVTRLQAAVLDCAGPLPDRRAHKPAEKSTVTLGVALPGFLDGPRARPIHLSNVPALNGIPLRKQLERATGWPVILEADTNAGACGEYYLGAGRGARRLLYLALGTGVGVAMVVGGAILRVSHHTVGQVAHLSLDPDGPRCKCGARGCVESVLGTRGILWRARRAARRGANIPAKDRKTPADLLAAARSGSRDARRVYSELGALMGSTLSELANFLSPDRIVVGGGIAGAGPYLLQPAWKTLRKRVHPRLREKLSLHPARLGPFSGAVGAAILSRGSPGK